MPVIKIKFTPELDKAIISLASQINLDHSSLAASLIQANHAPKTKNKPPTHTNTKPHPSTPPKPKEASQPPPEPTTYAFSLDTLLGK